MVILYLFFTVQTRNVFGNVIHRTGTIQCDGCNEMVKFGGTHLREHALHAPAFHLKHANHIAARQELERFRVFDGNVGQTEINVVSFLDELARFAHDGEMREPEKINFEQTDVFEVSHRKLRDGRTRLVAARGAMQRRVFDNGLVGDDDARRVRGRVARDAFQQFRIVNQLAQIIGAFVQLAKFFDFFECAVNRFAGTHRNQFRHTVHFGERIIERAPHIANRRFCQHFAERDDLGDIVVAVLVARVIYHFFARVVGKIQINVRHRNAVGIQKAFKDEIVLERVEMRNAETVRHHRARRRTARVCPNALRARVTRQIPHDEKVRVKAHLVNDAEFVM